MTYQINELSIDLLEKDPGQYLHVLHWLGNMGYEDSVKKKLNEKLYRGWYGNHALCLDRLVGSINDKTKSMSLSPDSFYGSECNEGIHEDLGITILNKMVSLGVDIHDTDYYDDNIINASREGALTYRTENNRFKEKVKEYFDQTQ